MGNSGVMRFDLPFQAEPPPLTSTGVTALVERRATSHGIDVTVLDAADDRLLRCGIVLAHRVQDQVGAWYLAAPGWQPYLPAECSVPVDASGELPAQFVSWLRPFLRRAPLGPVAALDCERRDYLMRSGNTPVGTIRDEQVRLRRGGEVVARYREVTVTPSQDLSAEQRDGVARAMMQVEGRLVEEFPTLQQRLGPPATGGTDFPEPVRGNRREMTLEAFVRWLFATDLRALVVASLSAPESLGELFDDIRGHVRGLASVLDPAWLQKLEQLLLECPRRGGIYCGRPGDPLAALSSSNAPPVRSSSFALPGSHHDDPRDDPTSPRTLLGPADSRVLDVIELLVGAVRAPRLGDASGEPAARLLLRRAERGARILGERCGGLSQDSPDQAWEAARAAAEQLSASGAVAVQLHGKAGRRVMKQLTGITRALGRCADVATVDSLEGLDVMAAFELGRQVERRRQCAAAERADFVAQWPDRVSTVTRLLAKARR
ncbi:MAG: hypothetical protein Q4D96_12245 [Propionibacteriaceae bacterium]|nr:hypothetical protein [Propionibacteriaceae bacterium]